jgi:hypothetical protein
MQISEHIENLLMNTLVLGKKDLKKNIDLEKHLFMSFYLEMS